MKISLLTGGADKPYALGLLSAIISKAVDVDFIGNKDMQDAEILTNNYVNFYNLRGEQNPKKPIKNKLFRVLKYYYEILKYAARTDSKLFHILWLNKFIFFDRTILNIIYKGMGKKLVFTAHNIDKQERDGKSSLYNRLSLRFMYQIVDHIFVHTKQMKSQLMNSFKIRESKITVIRFGINKTVPNSKLTRIQARKTLYLESQEKILLFFGNIAPYKGLEYLMPALALLKEKHKDLRLLIAGRIKNCQAYWNNIQNTIERYSLENKITKRLEFIADEEVELYFKSADVLILPYKFIFQSGILFLSYNFGLPVIATDVGSLREDIIDGKTGFVCQPENPYDLAKKLSIYFQSDLYKNLEINRNKIMKYANEKYSWDKIAEKTFTVYRSILESQKSVT